jgi:hypothetical protein
MITYRDEIFNTPKRLIKVNLENGFNPELRKKIPTRDRGLSLELMMTNKRKRIFNKRKSFRNKIRIKKRKLKCDI